MRRAVPATAQPNRPIAAIAAAGCLVAASLVAVSLLGAKVASATVSGTTLANLSAPTDAAAGSPLFAGPISCPTVSSCVEEAGYYTTDGTTQGLAIESLSSGTWKARSIKMPATSSPIIDVLPTGVACSSVGDCVAVAGFVTADQSGELVAIEHAGTWSTAGMLPTPSSVTPTAPYGVSEVSCPAGAGVCVIMGLGTLTSNLDDANYAIAYDFSTGYAGAPAIVSTGSTHLVDLSALSCPTSTYCVAVGGTSVATLSAGHWTLSALPSASTTTSSSSADLLGVYCDAPGDCVANGYYSFALEGVWTMRAGTWDAGQEVASPQATDLGGNIYLFAFQSSIACAGSVSECTLLGQSNAQASGVLAQSTSGRWGQYVDGPVTPAQRANAFVQFASCPAAATCVGVGSNFSGTSTFAAQWTQGGTAPAAPGIPAVLRFHDGAVTVSFSASSSTGAHYLVRASTGATAPAVAVASCASTTCTTEQLAVGRYALSVQAVYPDGRGSAPSASVAVLVPSAPSTPEFTSVVRRSHGVTAHWSAPAPYLGPAVAHYVLRVVGAGRVRLYGVAGTRRSASIGGLAAHVRYSITVCAVNTVGSSAYSQPWSFTVPS